MTKNPWAAVVGEARRASSLLLHSEAHRRELGRRLRAVPRGAVTAVGALRKLRCDRRALPIPFRLVPDYLRVHRQFWRAFGRFPDLQAPRSFNERIQWLKLFDRRPELVQLSDKVAVRTFVEERAGPEILTPLVAVLEQPEELLDLVIAVPSVIKSTHDSGSAIFIRNPDSWDRAAAVMKMRRAMLSRFGRASAEWPYTRIHPRIIVESMLLPPDGGEDLPDYKFHCVDGSVRWLQYIRGRFTGAQEMITDREGAPMAVHLDRNFSRMPEEDWVAPQHLERMVGIAELLARGFRYARIDLYQSIGGIKFGEMTFFPYSGIYRGAGQQDLGDLVDFDLTPLP